MKNLAKIKSLNPRRLLFLLLRFFFLFSISAVALEHWTRTSHARRVVAGDGLRGAWVWGGMGRVGLGVAVGCAVVASGIAAVAVWRRVRSRRGWARAVAVLKEFEEGCATPVSRLRQVVDAMAVEMHAGLASDGGSKLRMLLTFVDALPNGDEKGTYYALHLGGANFRVLKVELGGTRSAIMKHQDEYQLIPQDLVTSTIEGLFDFLAMTLKRLVEKDGEGSGQSDDTIKELGFTFPFPLKQLSISSGTLVKWTKEFAIEDANGKDVAQCLHEALIKSGLEMRVAALVNDTVGTLALGHYEDEDTVAAVIIGTGTNACYVERTDAIIKCQGLLTNSDEMVINMEWGNFWSSHLPRTPYDFDLDDDSPNQYDQGFEKMISGMYLGDIVRRVLLRMSQQSDIFGECAHLLSTPFILSTPLMASMHEDSTPDLKVVERILLDEFKLPNVSLKARRLVVRVCDVVTQRAARLAAAGIVGILKKIGRDGSGGVASGRVRGKPKRTVVAIEGALYVSYSSFKEYLNEAVAEILGEEVAPNVVLRVTEDGSGVGAALLAASHSLQR
ncbi:Hexokinase protein [Dioscorea alata]|uniref:Hexokinase protein n=1 Tax=Dioscorea alata TaxID=55571 RepID=A0ACB7VS90_DIOAL|nr:Hexokinase protein [Dioscorea alata]